MHGIFYRPTDLFYLNRTVQKQWFMIWLRSIFLSQVSNRMTHGTWQTNKAAIAVIEPRIDTFMVKTDNVNCDRLCIFDSLE